MSRPRALDLRLPLQRPHSRPGEPGSQTMIWVRVRLEIGIAGQSDRLAAAAALLQLAGRPVTAASVGEVSGISVTNPGLGRWCAALERDIGWFPDCGPDCDQPTADEEMAISEAAQDLLDQHKPLTIRAVVSATGLPRAVVRTGLQERQDLGDL